MRDEAPMMMAEAPLVFHAPYMSIWLPWTGGRLDMPCHQAAHSNDVPMPFFTARGQTISPYQRLLFWPALIR